MRQSASAHCDCRADRCAVRITQDGVSGTESPVDKRNRGSPAAGGASPSLAFPASSSHASAAAASAMSDDSPVAPAAAATRTTRGALALAHTPSPPPAAAAAASAGSASARSAAGNSPAPGESKEDKAADPNAIQPSPSQSMQHMELFALKLDASLRSLEQILNFRALAHCAPAASPLSHDVHARYGPSHARQGGRLMDRWREGLSDDSSYAWNQRRSDLLVSQQLLA